MRSYKKKRHVRGGSVQHFKVGGARKSKQKRLSKKKGGGVIFVMGPNGQVMRMPPMGMERMLMTPQMPPRLPMQVHGHSGSSGCGVGNRISPLSGLLQKLKERKEQQARLSMNNSKKTNKGRGKKRRSKKSRSEKRRSKKGRSKRG